MHGVPLAHGEQGLSIRAIETPTARDEAVALFHEGNRCLAASDAPQAEACYREALRLTPDFAQAQANLGLVLERRGLAYEAEACYRRSLAIDPSHPEAHLNLGALLAQQKRFAAAEAAYCTALALAPRHAAAWTNLGVLYACMQREAEAEVCHRTALNIDAAYATACFNLSYLMLRQGRLDEGWRCLEARTWYAALAPRLPCPRWQGEALDGRTVLVVYEAGHGDVIQFCRYAALLKRRGAASITLLCHPALQRLTATLDDVDAVLPYDAPLPDAHWDFWVPLLSLPYHFKTRLDSIPADLPYLRADPGCVAAWNVRLPRKGLRVGLVWKGNPRFENDADRSLPSLATLAPLAGLPGVRLVSLQKGAGEDEALSPPAGMRVLAVGSELSDFGDTAAVVANLDLVISVDTAVAHLAGALAVPCWVLLPHYKTDWRWLKDRSDTPWYPRVMRLFRQPSDGDWESVVACVTAELGRLVTRR